MEIKPIREFTWRAITGIEHTLCHVEPVRQLEADFEEAIEALEELTIESINLEYSIASHRKHKNALTTALRKNQTTIKIIEKAYGESWEDIRREK